MELRKKSKGVYVSAGPLTLLSGKDIALLKKVVASSPRGRSRICTHRSINDKVQEMVIAVPRSGYIRPHKHLGKGESMCAIEGSADVMIFDGKGNLKKVFCISAPCGRGIFYYRIDKPVFHTLLVRSKFFIFHESTPGPFSKKSSVAAPWAPPEERPKDGLRYLRALTGKRRRK